MAAILIVMVGFSRVYLGNHYPTDVLCGYLGGAIVIVVMNLLRKYIKNEAVLYAVLVLVGLPGFFYCTSDDYFTAYGLLIGMCLGFLFEARYVKFENTRNVLRMILRVLVGGGLYLGLNTLLKLPFDADFLASGTLAAHLVRTVRYIVIIFLLIGVYPMAFKIWDNIEKKKAEK